MSFPNREEYAGKQYRGGEIKEFHRGAIYPSHMLYSEQDDKPLRIFYYEILLRSNLSKAFIDFSNSGRNTTQDADITSSFIPEEPLRQIQIINDGTADYVRVGINVGSAGAPYLKVKFAEEITLPFVGAASIWNNRFLIYNMVLQANTSNATVRIIGIP